MPIKMAKSSSIYVYMFYIRAMFPAWIAYFLK